MSPTLSRLVRVWFSPVARGVFRVVFQSGDALKLDGLLRLLRVKGYMGNPLTLFKSKFILQLDTIIISQYTT